MNFLKKFNEEKTRCIAIPENLKMVGFFPAKFPKTKSLCLIKTGDVLNDEFFHNYKTPRLID